jgi:hypothetical protein
MRSLVLSALLSTALLASAAHAQNTAQPAQQQPAAAAATTPAPAQQRVRGTIVSFDGTMLTVKSDQGQTFVVGVLPTTRYVYNEPRKLTDIHPHDFIASAALTGADGKLHAQEVRIFPEAMRGLGEGHYDMDQPNRTMTNATVEEVTGVSNNGTLKVTYHGDAAAGSPNCSGHAPANGGGCTGEVTLNVAPGVPITAYIQGDQSALVPNAAVSMLVVTGPDGKLITPRMLVEHNGIKPLM